MGCDIRKNPKGYYSLFVNGKFEGNYDNFSEAVKAYEEMQEEAESA